MSTSTQQPEDLWDGLEDTMYGNPYIAEPPATGRDNVTPSSVVLQPIEPQSSVTIEDSASGPRTTVKVYSKDAHEAMRLALVLYGELRHQLGLDDTPALRVADRRA